MSTENNKWKIGPMTPTKFIQCRADTWSAGDKSGYKLSFTFENQEGVKIYDGFYFQKGMNKTLFETTIKRSRHMVNVVKENGWKDAGDFGKDVLNFLHKLSDQCNLSKGKTFYLKTLYLLKENGQKIPKFGKTVRFIAPYVKGESLMYSGEEEENPMYATKSI
jgi:hypothetical protein